MCPAGTYLADAASTATSHDALTDCAICGSGTYSTATAATASSTCVACPAGTYLADAATTATSHDALVDLGFFNLSSNSFNRPSKTGLVRKSLRCPLSLRALLSSVIAATFLSTFVRLWRTY